MEIPFAQLSFPEIYEQALVGPLFRPFAEILLDDADVRTGNRVLDVACGTGIVARLARERAGAEATVVGVDLSPPMVTVARRIAPDIDWRVGDACALPLQDGEQFDVVTCHQGLQFVPDLMAAGRELRRALAPKGRVAVGVWRPDEELAVMLELRHIAERHVGPITDRRHSFGDLATLEALLLDSGFHDVRSRAVRRTLRFADGFVFARLNAMALISMSAAGKDLNEEERGRIAADIVRDSQDVVRQNTDDAGFSYELSANIATARG